MMIKRVLLTIGWMLVILVVYLSLTPHPPEPMRFENADKFEHALAYAALSFWFCHIYSSVISRLLVIAALVGLGVGLEYVQGWTGYRTFDVMDMLADGAGVLLGWMLVLTPLMRVLADVERRLAR
jgi:VanZ family protein